MATRLGAWLWNSNWHQTFSLRQTPKSRSEDSPFNRFSEANMEMQMRGTVSYDLRVVTNSRTWIWTWNLNWSASVLWFTCSNAQGVWDSAFRFCWFHELTGWTPLGSGGPQRSFEKVFLKVMECKIILNQRFRFVDLWSDQWMVSMVWIDALRT